MNLCVEETKSRGVEMPEKHQFRFENLTVWQSARRLSGEVYSATQGFPKEELFGLTSQIRRAAVSIGANIAEGSGRNSDADFARFLEIAYGSAMELASLLYLASDAGRLDIATRGVLLGLTAEVTAQIASLNRTLQVGHTKTPFPRKNRE
jgi:four helix bundle protein